VKRLEEETVYSAIAVASEEHQDVLFAKQNVVGVGTGHKITDGVDTGEPCITVFVSQKLDKELLRAADLIDPEIKG